MLFRSLSELKPPLEFGDVENSLGSEFRNLVDWMRGTVMKVKSARPPFCLRAFPVTLFF